MPYTTKKTTTLLVKSSSSWKAHKESFKGQNAQPRASLQAVKDPETGKIETEPTKQAQIFEKYFKDSWQAINIKHGTYLPEEAPRIYPWEHTENESGNNLQTPLNYKQKSLWMNQMVLKIETGYIPQYLTKVHLTNALKP
jgi:hypothetical protein